MSNQIQNPKSKKKSRTCSPIWHLDFDICHSLCGGFTILETLVALSIIVSTLVGPVALITRGIAAASFSKNRLTALNLAQEGIELVRVIRENNITCDYLGTTRSWDEHPTGGSMQGTYGVDALDTISVLCGGNTVIFPRLSGSCAVPLRRDAQGFYAYAGGQFSPFIRCVDVCSPPTAAPCNGASDPGIPESNQMEIASTVTWRERGTEQSVVLKERLYNWR